MSFHSDIPLKTNSSATSALSHPLRWRFLFAALAVVLGVGVLGARSYWLQSVKGDEFERTASSNALHQNLLRPERGVILSSDGTVLAANLPSYDLVFVAKGVSRDEIERISEGLAELLDVDREDMESKLKTAFRRPLAPHIIASDVPRVTLSRVLENSAALPGVSISENSRREYRLGPAAAHVIGYIGEVSQSELDDELSLDMGDRVGRSGVELALENNVSGRKGSELVLLDALGQTVKTLHSRTPVGGDKVVLTIDARLQKLAHREFEGRGGGFVAIEPKTGRILALYSAPTFDPNIFVNSKMSEARKQILNDTGVPLFNRALQAVYPPGSTFKTVTMIAGLKSGRLTPGTTFHCDGSHEGMGCWKDSGHGTIDLLTAYKNSCNVYFYKAGEKIWIDPIADVSRRLGLDARPGFGIGPEAAGLVPTPEWERKNVKGPDGQHWGAGDVRNTAIGQGYVTASPAQMVLVAAAAANDGRRMAPGIVEYIEDAEGKRVFQFKPVLADDVGLTPAQGRFVREAMGSVVSGGTARRAMVKGLEVGGKTGTAQNPHGGDHAWFIGAAPMDDPKIAFGVFVENAGAGGGAVAAPIASRIISEYAKAKGWVE